MLNKLERLKEPAAGQASSSGPAHQRHCSHKQAWRAGGRCSPCGLPTIRLWFSSQDQEVTATTHSQPLNTHKEAEIKHMEHAKSSPPCLLQTQLKLSGGCASPCFCFPNLKEEHLVGGAHLLQESKKLNFQVFRLRSRGSLLEGG